MKKILKNLNTKYPKLMEFARFLCVGTLTTLIDMLVMSLVLYLFNPQSYPSFSSIFVSNYQPTTTATILGTASGFITGLLLSYILSVNIVFINRQKGKNVKSFILFVLLSLGGLAIHTIGMYLCYTLLGINEWVVKVLLTFVVLIYNYFSKKIIIFKEETKDETKI